MLSFGLHAAIVGAIVLAAYLGRPKSPVAQAFEVVVGEGDDYMATRAPKLGTPGGSKEETATKSSATPAQNNYARKLLTAVYNGKAKAERQIRKEREAEAKQAAEEAKRAAVEAAKREKLTKESFDKQNKTSPTPTPKATTRNVARIDAEGIRKGVIGGFAENTTGGGGGKSLTAAERSVAEGYEALLLQRLKDELDRTPALDDGLQATAEFHVLANGRLTQARITRSSGNDAFDRAVLAAIAAVRMPERPKGFQEVVIVPFNTINQAR
jgi:colicin import membrane protein